MHLITRIVKLEEKAPGCAWCALRLVWCHDEVTVVNGEWRCVCPECGKDRTGYAKIIDRELWEAI